MTVQTSASPASEQLHEGAVAAGAFPFPLSEAGESRYLKWIRDHANYMAVRGWSDYFRATSVLLRGAFVNLLVVLPLLLSIAIVAAAIKVWAFDLPFALTWTLLGVTALVFASFPAVTFVEKIAGYRRSQDTGSDSSVQQRDLAERRVGSLLMALAGVAAFEALPVLIDPFHAWMIEYQVGWERLSSVVAAGVVVSSAADKVLSKLPGAARIMATAAFGALGLLLPLLIVLSVAEGLCFDPPPAAVYWQFSPMAAIWCFPLLLLVGLLTAVLKGALSFRDLLGMALAVVASFLLATLAVEQGDRLGVDLHGAVTKVEAQLGKNFPKLPAGAHEILVRKAGPYFTNVLQMAEEVSDAHQQRLPAARRLGPDGSAQEQTVTFTTGFPDSLSRLRHAQMPQLLRGDLDELLEKVQHEVDGQSGRTPAIETEITRLVAKVEVVHGVFEHQVPEELLVHVSTLSDADLETLCMDDPRDLQRPADHLSGRYRELMRIADDELRNVLNALVALGRDLRAARWETNQSAHVAADRESSDELIVEMRAAAFPTKVLPVAVIALLLLGFCRLTVDVNLTAIHGLYRDRLASAFLVGADNEGDVDIEGDIDLADLCCHEAFSTAPYHLINAALNLQGSRDIGLRDRRCDFFIFSKKFIGGMRTGYCRSESMERVFPQMSLASAMAISAAAASPNMGRATSPPLVALMTLLNVRLGIWVPNPGVLEEALDPSGRSRAKLRDVQARGFSFEQVFTEELAQMQARWRHLPCPSARRLAEGTRPTVEHGLVGLALSGGGIRSAAVNLGLVQTLERRGLFGHVDYMSTVSGGGYLGSSISALMRRKTPTESEVAGIVSVRTDEAGDIVVSVASTAKGPAKTIEHRYAKGARLAVESGQSVKAGQRLVRTQTDPPVRAEGFWRSYWSRRSFGELYRWQVPSRALLWEMASRLDENKRWVNLSDGGHIENLGAIELLRRRCKYVIIGDSEADPEHRFGSLATLIRTARLDLAIHIDIDTTPLRLQDGHSRQHWTAGRITYPNEAAPGYLLYLKSSITGDEDEVIREYRHGHPSFPHESTADQMFVEAQFEAYRSLGQHIAEQPLYEPQPGKRIERQQMSYAELRQFFETIARATQKPRADEGAVLVGGGVQEA